MDSPKYTGEGGKWPVNKNKKFGEWDFKGFFKRPEEKESENQNLVESLNRLGRFEESLNKKKEPENSLAGKIELVGPEKTGYFNIGSYNVNLCDEALDVKNQKVKKPIDECNVLLLNFAKDILEDIVNDAVKNFKNTSLSFEMRYSIKPSINIDFENGKDVVIDEAIDIYFDLEIDSNYFFASAVIFQPDKKRDVAIYQVLKDCYEPIGAGAVIIQPTGEYDIVKFKELKIDP